MAEEITVTKYKSINGNVYDTIEDANVADKRWKADNEVNIADVIRRLEYTASKDIQRKSGHYPRLISTIEKYDDQYFVCNSEEGMLNAYIDLVTERLRTGYYTEKKDNMMANYITTGLHKIAAYGFIMSRTSYEYEDIINIEATVYK